MIIGIDCDEPLADTANAIFTFHNERYGTTFKREDHTEYDLSKTWGGTLPEANQKVMEFFQTDYFQNVRPMPGSVEAITKLHRDHELYVITSRPPEIAQATREWLRTHYAGRLDKVYFTDEFARFLAARSEQVTKADTCRTLKIELYIEDCAEHANEVAEANIPVLLFSCPWNKGKPLHPHVSRVESWQEVTKIVSRSI